MLFSFERNTSFSFFMCLICEVNLRVIHETICVCKIIGHRDRKKAATFDYLLIFHFFTANSFPDLYFNTFLLQTTNLYCSPFLLSSLFNVANHFHDKKKSYRKINWYSFKTFPVYAIVELFSMREIPLYNFTYLYSRQLQKAPFFRFYI